MSEQDRLDELGRMADDIKGFIKVAKVIWGTFGMGCEISFADDGEVIIGDVTGYETVEMIDREDEYHVEHFGSMSLKTDFELSEEGIAELLLKLNNYQNKRKTLVLELGG